MEKPKEERVKEGVRLLKELAAIGVEQTSPGFDELKAQITAWVSTGKRWEGTIMFPTYRRKAEIVLPYKATQTATLAFKQIKIGY